MGAAEFINPKSMMTPGIASTAILLVANTLNLHFELKASVTALVLSFLIGLVVFLAEQMKLIERVIYYIVNSLILFSMAVGGNQGIVSLSAPVNRPNELSLIAQPFNQEYARQVAYQRVLNENLADRVEVLKSVISSSNSASLNNLEIQQALHESASAIQMSNARFNEHSDYQAFDAQKVYQKVLNENLALRLETLESVITSGEAASLDNPEVQRAFKEYEEVLKQTEWYLSTLDAVNTENIAGAQSTEADKKLFKSWF
ncbi:MAG: hypothetical protein KKE30_20535 [Gammaproteobacteria bacterium]|nr:hypothetical protein [Gammaproteobacteria bacterium]MBU1555187.1 hypothetical protein [Gammaproteobacteria bacterium]MBU2071142.1 hypothetical protein [Gammaproteobacteria bacterium]MBU2184408.1 hypothetical protein [Gammaproteobacteria bacterium]MBU2206210.1 hypothetical protein [Gammaproteobacteria bacterium]